MSTHTCTVVVSADGAACNQPAVAEFTSRYSGTTYYECADHCAIPHEPVSHAPSAAAYATRSQAPFLLVRDGKVVGYAYSHSDAVAKRAARLGATVVPNVVK